MRSRPSPQPQPLRLWNTFQPETHRQLVALWSDLLHRQLAAAREQAHEPGKSCHESSVAQGRGAAS